MYRQYFLSFCLIIKYFFFKKKEVSLKKKSASDCRECQILITVGISEYIAGNGENLTEKRHKF